MEKRSFATKRNYIALKQAVSEHRQKAGFATKRNYIALKLVPRSA